MAESIKKDKRIRSVGGRVQNQIGQGSIDAQPIGNDWWYLDPTYFSALTLSGNHWLYAPDLAVGEIFRLGDRIKILQGGLTKYFFVYYIDSDNSNVYVTAGSDYALTTGSISEIHLSRISQPLGYPSYFDMLIECEAWFGGDAKTAEDSDSLQIWSNGAQIYWKINSNILDIDPPPTETYYLLFIKLPIKNNIPLVGQGPVSWAEAQDGHYTTGIYDNVTLAYPNQAKLGFFPYGSIYFSPIAGTSIRFRTEGSFTVESI